MPDTTTVTALLLVLGPVLGAIPVANPSLLRIWSMAPAEHRATVGAHRRAWLALNAGFVAATVTTSAGLAILALDRRPWDGSGAALLAGGAAYAVGGVLWCVVLAARSRITPATADLLAAGAPTEPAEALVGAALGGLFQGYVLITAVALAVVGLALALGGGVAAPIAWLAVAVGAAAFALLLATGDLVPAVLYPPTILIGVALLAGWT